MGQRISFCLSISPSFYLKQKVQLFKCYVQFDNKMHNGRYSIDANSNRQAK